MMRSRKILLTGGTGFVCSFLAAELLRRGHKLYFLARPKDDRPAKDRVIDALALAGLAPDFDPAFIVYSGDFSESRAGLCQQDLAELRSLQIDDIVHGGGSVSFSHEDAMQTLNSNLVGTRNMLELADFLGVVNFHYISTAYACANTKTILHFENEHLVDRPGFNNSYEYSKFLACNFVKQWGKRTHLNRAMIYEPSIVIGDSRSGRAFNFNGFYYASMVYYLTSRRSQAANGVKPQVTLKVPGHQSAEINLITIDYFLEQFLKIMDVGQEGVYKIVSEECLTFGELQSMVAQFFGLAGVSVSNSRKLVLEIFGQEEKELKLFLASKLLMFVPYLSRTFKFDTTSSLKVLGTRYQTHPPISQELISRLMTHAVENKYKLSA